MTIDGEPSALDVTMFTTNDRSAAGGRGQTLRRAIEARLGALDDERSILGMVSFDPVELIAVPKRAIASQMTAVVDAYEDAVRSSPGSVDRLQLCLALPWVRGAGITLTTDLPGRRRVSVHMHAPRGDAASTVDQFILERIARKTSQLAPWGKGILVIVHGFDATAADVRAGFDRLGRCPWWRVYWAGPSPENVERVGGSGA